MLVAVVALAYGAGIRGQGLGIRGQKSEIRGQNWMSDFFEKSDIFGRMHALCSIR